MTASGRFRAFTNVRLRLHVLFQVPRRLIKIKALDLR